MVAEFHMWEMTTPLLYALLRTALKSGLNSVTCDTLEGQKTECIQGEQLRQWRA